MTISTILLGFALAIAAYLALGYLFHGVLSPEQTPDPDTYFDAGDTFGSERVGDQITILERQHDGFAVELQFGPHAEGPPMHIQTGWDETFRAVSGKLGLIVDGETKILAPGEEFTVERGVPHKPYNPTDEPIVCRTVMPAAFVVYLSQVYGFIDEDERNMKPPRMIFQMALFNQYFDSYLAEGPPVSVQKVLNFLLRPLARLMGYRSYYEKYRV